MYTAADKWLSVERFVYRGEVVGVAGRQASGLFMFTDTLMLMARCYMSKNSSNMMDVYSSKISQQ